MVFQKHHILLGRFKPDPSSYSMLLMSGGMRKWEAPKAEEPILAVRRQPDKNDDKSNDRMIAVFKKDADGIRHCRSSTMRPVARK